MSKNPKKDNNIKENKKTDFSKEKFLDYMSGDSAYRGEILPEKEEPVINRSSLILRYLKVLGLGTIISLIYIAFRINGDKGIRFYLTNAFFVSGVILAGIGGLSAINKEGFYDIGQYGLKKVLRLKSIMGEDKKPINFYEYKEQKKSVRVAKWDWLIVGVLFLTLSFFMVFFKLSE